MKKSRYRGLARICNFLLASIFLFILVGLLPAGSTQAAVVKPEQKIWESLLKFGDASSYSFSGSLAYTGKSSINFTDLLLDPTALNKKAPAKYETVTVDMKGGKQIFTPFQSQSWVAITTKSSDKKAPSFGMEVRSIGEKTYLALTSAQNMPAEINNFLNTWVQLDFGSFLKDLKLDQLLAEKASAQNQTDEEEQLRQLRDLFLKNKVMTIRGRYAQKINGDYFDVYNISVNKNNLKKFIIASNDLAGGEVLTVRQLANLDKEIAKTKTVTAKIWIGRKDNYPYRIDFTAIGAQSREKSVIRINLKDYNQPISVYEPASFLTLEELFNQLFPNMSSVLDATTTTPTSSLVL